jgi:cardiolipin synthase
MSQQPARAPITTSDRIWTIPNIISFFRLLGVPLFLWLLLGPQHDVAAVIVLAIGGTTDWVDGYVARRMGQVSRLGELLDPFADRLYILATLVGFTLREVVPLWLTAALLLRELVLGIALLVLRRHGHGPPPVHYVGKTGTFVLLGAFPVLLLAAAVPATQPVAGAIGWGLAWWALGLYWAAAVLYLAQVVALLRADRAGGEGPGGPGPAPVGPPPAPTSSPTVAPPTAPADGTGVIGPAAPESTPDPSTPGPSSAGLSTPVNGASAADPAVPGSKAGLPSGGAGAGPAVPGSKAGPSSDGAEAGRMGARGARAFGPVGGAPAVAG